MTIKSTDHFVRQRRNLILISLLIIFYKAADLVIEEISFLGNKTTVGNPQIVSLSLGIFFIYYLWRFFTASNEEEAFSKFIGKKSGQRRRLAENLAYYLLQKKLNLKSRTQFALNINRQRIHDKKSQGIKAFCFDIQPYPSHLSEEEKKRLKEKSQFDISGFIIFILDIFAFFIVCFRQSQFSEYIFPYILALIAMFEIFGFDIVQKTLNLIS